MTSGILCCIQVTLICITFFEELVHHRHYSAKVFLMTAILKQNQTNCSREEKLLFPEVK